MLLGLWVLTGRGLWALYYCWAAPTSWKAWVSEAAAGTRGGFEVGPALTMTVAMMESSASLKPSMRWELWGPSSSLLCRDESPSKSTACSWVWGLDMVGPPSCHSSLGRSVALISGMSQVANPADFSHFNVETRARYWDKERDTSQGSPFRFPATGKEYQHQTHQWALWLGWYTACLCESTDDTG